MRVALLFVFFAGVILVVLNELIAARPPPVEYRYLPRDLDTYLREDPYASVAFEKMFRDPEVPR